MTKLDARLMLTKAFGMRRELRCMDFSVTPGAVIHTAYYAAFHAARAVLHDAHGTVSTKHRAVHTAFEALAKSGSDDMRCLAEDLRAAYEARLLQDYTGEVPTVDMAENAAAVAEAFLAFAARRLGLPTDTP